MLYRIYYTSDEGDSGYEQVEASSAADARRQVQNRLSGIMGLELGTIQQIGKKDDKKDDKKEEKKKVVEEKPKAKDEKGPTPDLDTLLAEREAEIEALKKEALEQERKNKERIDDVTSNLEQYYQEMGGEEVTERRDGYDPMALGSVTGSYGDRFRRQSLERQSPLAGFLEGISQAYGAQDIPGGYAGRNYLESLADPAEAAYGIMNVLDRPYAGTTGELDFGEFAQNLFATGANPREALSGILSGGIEDLAKVSGAGLEGMRSINPGKAQRVGALINPDVVSPGATGYQDINDLINFAYQAQRQKYSPLALQQIQRGQGGQDRLWADYVRQMQPEGGGMPTETANFAKFIQSRFGL